jgi:hypothetical protein
MTSQSKIVQLSALIAQHTATINDFFIEKRLPLPSLEADAPWSLPIPDDADEIKAVRLALIEACAELQALVTGPKESLQVNVRQIARHFIAPILLESVHCIRQYSHHSALQSRQVVRRE